MNSQISYFFVGNTNCRLSTTFKNSVFRFKNMNDRLDAVFKISCFVVKKRMTPWVQFSKFSI